MSTNKFAEKQLKKHGWKEGSGLGKEEAGIKEAIKVKIKNDTAGIGHNRGDEFTFHWWDHVFNKAAGSISVEDSEEGVALKKSASNGPISNTRTKSYDNKAMLYGKFVKVTRDTNIPTAERAHALGVLYAITHDGVEKKKMTESRHKYRQT